MGEHNGDISPIVHTPELENLSTPYYFFDADHAIAHAEWMRTRLGDTIGLCFAMKTNPFLVKHLSPVSDRVEVCSFGEYNICKEVKVPAEKLFISGVVKKPEELEEILKDCGNRAVYTAESPRQFELLCDFAMRHQTTLRIYPRLSSGNQFGMDEATIRTLLAKSKDMQYVEVEGIHYYPGTMKKSPETCIKAIQKLDRFLCDLQAEGYPLRGLEYGPGIPAQYFQEKSFPEIGEYLDAVQSAVESMIWKGKVTIELGRAFVSGSGFYCTEVIDRKNTKGTEYLLVDGGVHQLSYDGQVRGMYHPFTEVISERSKVKSERSKEKSGEFQYTICGSLCTVNDVLTAGISFEQPVEIGDKIVFLQTGGYSAFEGMALFLSHELPDIYIRKDNEICEQRSRRETWPMNMPEMKK